MRRNISIIGSCCSRELFNTPILDGVFDVDRYAFKVCAWDMLREGLGVDKNEIDKIKSIPEFTRRMLWYEFNKVTLAEIEKMNREYLLIDLLNICHEVDCVSFGGKEVYMQDSYDKISKHYKDLKTNPYFAELETRRIPFSEINEELVIGGLRAFAEWVKDNFEMDRVVIYSVDFARKYYDLNGNTRHYDKGIIEAREKDFEIIRKYTEILAELLPGARLMRDVGDKYGEYGFFDLSQPIPSPVHYCIEDYHRQSEELLRILDIDWRADYPHLHSPMAVEYIRIKNMLCNNLIQKAKSEREKSPIAVQCFTLNDYISKIERLEDFIIVISVRDEGGRLFHRFDKSRLGLTAGLKFRDSYIAVVDKSRDFKYESNSQQRITYDYSVGSHKIHIESSGFLVGNASVVSLDGMENLSKNKRGLNIVLFDAKTLAVVDSAYCDTNSDENLLVYSDYFREAKIKTV